MIVHTNKYKYYRNIKKTLNYLLKKNHKDYFDSGKVYFDYRHSHEEVQLIYTFNLKTKNGDQRLAYVQDSLFDFCFGMGKIISQDKTPESTIDLIVKNYDNLENKFLTKLNFIHDISQKINLLDLCFYVNPPNNEIFFKILGAQNLSFKIGISYDFYDQSLVPKEVALKLVKEDNEFHFTLAETTSDDNFDDFLRDVKIQIIKEINELNNYSNNCFKILQDLGKE